MRFLLLAAVAVAALAAAGCSTIAVNQDFDTAANFAAYKTYAWIAQQAPMPGDAKTALQSNTLIDKRVKTNVDAELAAKGMVLTADNPDAFLVYHLGIDQKIDVQDWGYSYPRYPYGGWYGGQVDVYQYNEGTLIVDIVDAKTNQLVWRGTATKTIDESASPEQREANLKEVVSRIFEKYPPK